MDGKILKNIIEWSLCFILAIILAVLIRYYLISPTIVKQSSMYPILQEKQRILLNRTYRISNSKYKRGDIITFEAPSTDIENINMQNPIALYQYTADNLLEKLFYNVFELNKTSYIKRIIAIEGDKIEIINGKVFLNGKELQETYLKQETITQQVYFNDIIVPKGCVFVMGDNRNESMDSRKFGCIPVEKIEGIVCFRYWPLDRFEKIK